jgi:hypothetical protein
MIAFPKEFPFHRQTGPSLARIREEAGVASSTLAERLSISPAKLDAFEKAAEFDFQVLLSAFDILASNFRSDQAAAFVDFAGTDFVHTPRPHFFHPDRPLLEQAERALQDIEQANQSLLLKTVVGRHLTQFVTPIKEAAARVSRRDLSLVFIGEKGVGKSSAICALFGLEALDTSKEAPKLTGVLEDGGGATTVCDVHVVEEERYALTIDPVLEIEVDRLIMDFAAHCWDKFHRRSGVTEARPIAPEAERFIRNMSGLTRKSRKRHRRDPARIEIDLAQELLRDRHFPSLEAFYLHVRALVGYDRRVHTEFVIASTVEEARHDERLLALSQFFRRANNGRLADAPFPRRMTVSVPRFLDTLADESGHRLPFRITLVDTMGVGEIVVREDIGHWLRDPSAVVVLCSNFANMPDVSTRHLLAHMKETFGVSPSNGKVVVLGLPRKGNGLAVKLDDGMPPEDEEDGYDIKAIRAAGDLQARGLGEVLSLYANADPACRYLDVAREGLASALDQVHAVHATQLEGFVRAVRSLLENPENIEVIAAVEEVAARIRSFLDLAGRFEQRSRYVSQDVLELLAKAHPMVLWAMLRRNGEYESLNVYYLFGTSASKAALERSAEWFAALETFLRDLGEQQKFDQAREIILFVLSQLPRLRSSLSKRIEDLARKSAKAHLADQTVWDECLAEWGTGRGFRQRVIEHLHRWCSVHLELADSLEISLLSAWETDVRGPLANFTRR